MRPSNRAAAYPTARDGCPILSITANATFGRCAATAALCGVFTTNCDNAADAAGLPCKRLISLIPSSSETSSKEPLFLYSLRAQSKEIKALGTNLLSCDAAEICAASCRKGNLPIEPRMPTASNNSGNTAKTAFSQRPSVCRTRSLPANARGKAACTRPPPDHSQAQQYA